MNSDPKLSLSTDKTREEQQFVIDGCKITVRYGTGRNPNRVDEIRSLLLTAQFKTE